MMLRTGIAATAALIVATGAGAQQIYEGFDYPDGSLQGRAGGQNMSGSWAWDHYPVASGSLAYENLLTSGGRAQQVYSGYTYPGNTRPYDAATYAALVEGGEFWFSCTFNNGGTVSYAYLTLDPVGMGSISLRDDGLMSYGGSHKSGAFTPGEASFLVGRLVVTGPNNDGANDTLTLWTNCTPGLASPDTAAAITKTIAFEHVANVDFGIATQFGGGEMAVDEIRLGPSYASVAPTAPPSMDDQTTYLVSFGRAQYAGQPAAPEPWLNWNAWNFPGVGSTRTAYDAETGTDPAVLTLTDRNGHLRPWHSGTATTETFFGYPIPPEATALTFNAYNSEGAYFTIEVSDLEPDTDYVFQTWMVGSYFHPATAQTWTITGGAGSSYTAMKEGLDTSDPVRSTPAGTIEVRWDFPVRSSTLSAVECFAFQKATAVDSDGDGILDNEEIDVYGTDPNDPDSDDDGLDDGAELDAGTDPLDADTDDDGLGDGQEAGLGTDPLDPDSDDDGLTDGEEIVATTDPLNADTDGDGIGDLAEVLGGTSPILPDTDGDGIDDGCEAGLGTDPLVADTDGDGLSDGDEFSTYNTDPLDADTDDDGLVDGDEIALASDPFDPDTDDDGLVDGDEVGLGTNPLVADSDADGLSDGDEVGRGTNPLAADTDGDGLTDGDEVLVQGTSPLSADTDGDDVSDPDELFVYMTSPLSADTDGDGLGDGVEIALAAGGTCPDPLEADSDGDGVSDGDESSQGRMVCNAEPIADCFVDQLTDIGAMAQVTMRGGGSSDLEDAVGDLDFEWTIDDGATTWSVFGVDVQEALDYGSYVITLTVTDSDGGVGTCSTPVTIDPADLAVFDADKIEVKFGHDGGARDRVKISGEIGLPAGVDFTELDPLALIVLDVAGQDFLGTGMAPIVFDVHGGDGHHWKYRDDAGVLGITKLDIDWKGARFDYKQSGVPVKFESEVITSAETVLTVEYKSKDIEGAFTLDIDGTVFTVGEDAVMTVADPAASIEVKKAGKKVEVTLPFPLTENSVITFGGALSGVVPVGDHYENSLGRFKLEAESGAPLAAGSATNPRTVGLSILAGSVYPGSSGADADELDVKSDKWKTKK